MRLLIERSELMRTLGHVTSVVERRTTLPILSNVLLNADMEGLEIKGTDLEREVVESAAAEVATPGGTTVSAHILHDIVRKLPDGAKVELALDNEQPRLAISSGRSRFFLPVLSADEFPDLAAGEMTSEFEIAASDLKRLIEKTRFAISTEETRYYLNGIYFHVAESNGAAKLRAVATDGHRLARLEMPAPAGAEEMPGIIVPRKTVHEILRLIEDSEATVGVALSESKIRFTTGSVVLTSKLIDGTFPDYVRVIPQSNDKTMTVANEPFKTAVDRVSTVSTDRGQPVKLSLESGRLTLAVTNTDGGSASEELPVEYGAEALEIGFNARYLLDIAGQLESENAHFSLADPGSPTVITDEGDDTALYVLMPMRV